MTASLIERVESAAEGSRELDAEIAETFGAQVVARFGGHEWRPDRTGIWLALPAFTNSLDAALALAERVLPGWVLQVCQNRHEDPVHQAARAWSVWFEPPSGRYVDHDTDREAVSATAPLALCAAILKAHEASK